jgi:Concanavalin A-like lectin/glucanases superfamily
MSMWLVALIPVAVLTTVFFFGFVGCTLDKEGKGRPDRSTGEWSPGDGSPGDGSPEVPAVTYADVVKADKPLAYWRLGEGGGQTAVDQVGLDVAFPAGLHAGTYNEGTPLPSEGDSASAPGTLKFGAPGLITNDPATSVDFDGGYVEVPHDGTLNPAQFSLEAWVHPAWEQGDTSFRSVVASYVFGQPQVGFSLGKNEDDHFEFSLCVGAGGWQTLVGDTSFQKGKDETYHLVASYDGMTLKLYENATLSNQMPLSDYAPAGSTPIQIGVGEPTPDKLYPFKGRIQEVAIYDYELDENIVQTHYLATL